MIVAIVVGLISSTWYLTRVPPAVAPPLVGEPGDWFGRWSGPVHQAVSGPLGEVFNFSFSKNVPGAKKPTWYLENYFQGYLNHGAFQQYWIQFDDDMTTSNLTYCGQLRGFFAALQPTKVTITMQEVRRNATYMEWYMEPNPFPVSARWVMELRDGGRQLYSKLMIPADNVVHVEMLLTRVPGEEPAPAPRPVPCTPDEWLAVPNKNDTLEWPKEPAEPIPVPEGAIKSRASCPLGFGNVRKRVKRALTAASEPPKAEHMGYENCYLVNPTMNFVVRWNWTTATEEIKVLMSATALHGSDISKQYLALGITPQWPLMKGMDIVMGYFAQDGRARHEGCVRSMYAELDIGVPIPSEKNQTITDREIWTEGRTMFVKWSRPWNTGHHNLGNPVRTFTLPSISFAMGPAAQTCTTEPGYHGALRGTYGFWWPNASVALPEWMKC